MQEINYDDLNRLTADFERVLRVFPEARREVSERVGKALLGSVKGRIGGRGKVMGWQTTAVGSGGGWAAVRAKAKTYQTTKSGRQYAVGYITNAIENGHKVRKSKSGRRPRAHTAYVQGKDAYHAAAVEADSVALEASQRLLTRLSAELGG